jgi:hypothetical protein
VVVAHICSGCGGCSVARLETLEQCIRVCKGIFEQEVGGVGDGGDRRREDEDNDQDVGTLTCLMRFATSSARTVIQSQV